MQKPAISAVEHMDFARQRADSNALIIEQRAAIRYLVSLKVKFRWTDVHGLPRQAGKKLLDCISI
jgi:hypothetical protein